jgi:uncharacterized membrane protein (DUF485 family)
MPPGRIGLAVAARLASFAGASGFPLRTPFPQSRRFLDLESAMTDPAIARIRDNPKYQELKSKRSSFGWLLTVVMLVVYYGFVSLIAFNKAFLGQRLGEGVTTIGIPLGLGVIIFTVLITGFYVRRANTEFDALTADILKEASK